MLSDFLNFVNVYKWANYVGMEDYADKLSFNVTTSIMLLFTVIITLKSYLLTSIECYTAIKPSGDKFDDYLKNYCWVHGTIPVHSNSTWPTDEKQWAIMDKTDRISYYQWVPFLLALQGVLFYLPRLCWQMITYNMSGADLEGLISMANESSTKVGEEKQKVVSQVAQNLENLLFDRRNIQLHSNKIVSGITKFKAILCCGKRTGRRLIFQYLFIKFLYLANVIGQIFLLQKFLHFDRADPQTSNFFGVYLLANIVSGREWNDTMYFPRVSYCFVYDIKHVGLSNNYLAQCVLPINMLNEKLYIFLWFWLVIVAILSCISTIQWILRIVRTGSRTAFLKKYLKVKQCFGVSDKQTLESFKQGFLRGDGVFILRMLAINAGDLVASDIIMELWRIYKASYDNEDFRKKKKANGSSAPPSEAITEPVEGEYV